MNVLLIGYRGTGKSTVARRLALAMAWEWVDADVEIEMAAGKSIASIFADDGEPAFRDLECRVLGRLAQRDRTVIAAGGGAVLRSENRAVLRSSGKVVWLTATPETILARVAADATTAARRPNLTTAGGEAEVRRLLAERTEFYHQTADIAVATDDRTPDEIAAEIIERLGMSAAASG